MKDLIYILDIFQEIGVKENKKDNFLNLVLGNYTHIYGLKNLNEY
jgi:hypothetical protein